jgi:hypothetical protein
VSSPVLDLVARLVVVAQLQTSVALVVLAVREVSAAPVVSATSRPPVQTVARAGMQDRAARVVLLQLPPVWVVLVVRAVRAVLVCLCVVTSVLLECAATTASRSS